jgi:plasmid stability protein
MATLHIRSVPDEMVDRLRALARARQRSLSAQVIALLERALAEETQQQAQVNLLDAPPAGAPDSTLLLREDRER